MIDVDHFKAVNDEFGHATGDKALRAIADMLRANTRVFDSVARYGGEEFVAVMPGTGADEASEAAERLRSAVEATQFTWASGKFARLTVSIGVACTAQASRPRPKRCCTPPIARCTRRSGRVAIASRSPPRWRRRRSPCPLLDLGFPERNVLAHDRIVFLQLQLSGLGPRVLLRHIEKASVGARNELDLNGVGFRHG